MGSPLTGFSVTPDLALVMSPVTRGPSVFLAVVECAFSQDRNDLMKKVQCEVEGWAQIAFVVVILISENHPYHSPKEGTQTWSFFSQLNVSFSEENFLALPQSIEACAVKLNKPTSTSGSHSINKPDSSSPLDPSISTEQSEAETNINSEAELEPQPIEIKPIMVTGHMWCNIRDVQYHVWTKEDRAQRIDLDNRCFFKFIYPPIEMGEVEWAIRKGLSAVKKGISKLLSISASKSTVHRLQAADLRVDFDWRVIQARVMASSQVTTWSHYQDWYFNTFHGTKHAHSDDNEYQPTESKNLFLTTFFLPYPWQEPSAETQAPKGRGHPTCSHCLPQHYHDNDSEEFIDIEQELGIDVDEENCERQENVQPQATATHTASTDPLATGNSCQGQSRRNIAHDINYFFWEEVWEEESLSLCNICNYLYSAKSSTTMCHCHLNSQHPLVYLKKIEENNWPVQSKYLMATFERGYTFNMLQEALNHPGAEISHLLPLPPPGVDYGVPVGKLPKGDPSIDLPEFSIQGLHEFLVNFIVSDDQLRVELKRAVGVISFTADIWSADKLDSYLAMMAHWIGHELGSVQSHSGQLAMKAALITFHCLPTSHMGKEIAKAILHLIDHAEIPVEKISHFTMDNAANNDTAMAAFTQTLQEEYFSSLPWTWGNSPRILKSMEYIMVVQEDPICCGQETVQCVHSSGQCQRNFQQTIESGNTNQSFMHSGIPSPLPVVQLLHDVGTRWDSTYYMINHLHTLCQAVDLWVREPQNVNLVLEKLEMMHWEVLQDLKFALHMSMKVFGACG
ncbi:hypothetical protein EDC04DRAFT_2606341 [Pisolithus marmoratus]|nr:hypothetical protein EDC04DRAFT_2606341 [Pisolithus marmoratus]